jgi:hypothetical protein
LSIERLHEYPSGSVGPSALLESLFRVGRNEDDGHLLPPCNKLVLKIQATHPRHLHIGYQAVNLSDDIGRQKRLGGIEYPGGEPQRSDQAFRRKANGLVIVNDRDQRKI